MRRLIDCGGAISKAPRFWCPRGLTSAFDPLQTLGELPHTPLMNVKELRGVMDNALREEGLDASRR